MIDEMASNAERATLRLRRATVSLALLSSIGLLIPTVGCAQEDARPSQAAVSPTPVLPQDTAGLMALLSSPDTDLRRRAAEALGKAGDPAAGAALLKELGDQDVYAKKAAAEALGLVFEKTPPGTPERDHAVEALIGLLRDPDYGVRYNSAEALSHLRDRRAVPELVRVLQKDADTSVRGHAAWALGQIQDPTAVEPLIAALSAGTDQWKVSYALGNIEDKRAATFLLQKLHARKFSMVSGAADFFVRQNDPALRPLLLDMLQKTKDMAVVNALCASPDRAFRTNVRRLAEELGIPAPQEEEETASPEPKK